MAARNLLSKTAQRLLTTRNISLSIKKHASLWTSDNIVKSPHKGIEIPNRTVPEHIFENMEIWADKIAMECGLTGRSYTYHQLYKYSRNFGSKLRTQLKIRDGDVVCIMMSNSPEYPIAALGALEAGAEVTTVNPMYTAYEVQRQLIQSDPKVLIGIPELVPILKEALSLAKKDIPIICLKDGSNPLPANTISFQEFALADNVDHSVLKEVSRTPDDVSFLPYSSGTTGLPKGVELTHRNIVVNCIQQDVDSIRHYDITTKTSQDSTFGVLPFYHLYGLAVIMIHKLSLGFKIVTLPKFQPNSFVESMKQHRINLLYAAPPLVLFLGSYAGVTEEHLSSLKTIVCGAAPLPRNDVMKVLNKAKHKIDFLQLYGLTEISPLATLTLPGSDHYSKAGFALPTTELRIVDSENKPLGPNEKGELLIRGPQVMKGYRNNIEATKAVIADDGWFRSGDLASIDETGEITIADRLKELIKVKGYQVPPAELENVLKEHPDILDVAVVGAPDAKTGEVPRAFVVLKEGSKPNADSITAFVKERVAEYKRVKDVTFLDELPKNPSGKILRRVLKEKYC
ncbi:4-coumarate--CoA ligase 3-like [Helicoverpa zea]|uniref:4-coumarate--CoA ligase 3-like n=1 Tax=Helicoverpa zea TaxID=7113 RepID=UPI001F59CA3A|nr:4-coumarate--CoA ligase 3-like [Helicoverpa zea]XP_047028474.1 4-coumarate--CoA ligase 3-like [Helicoverpa zea]XP_047028476.1 4-coumarate--CoA ligase 3-like [Helicoverpa zea]